MLRAPLPLVSALLVAGLRAGCSSTSEDKTAGWSPNRILRLRYLGESTYEILASENSKLEAGDHFVTGCFIKEQPLYLPYIERNGERTASFVAGRNGGLTLISIISQ